MGRRVELPPEYVVVEVVTVSGVSGHLWVAELDLNIRDDLEAY